MCVPSSSPISLSHVKSFLADNASPPVPILFPFAGKTRRSEDGTTSTPDLSIQGSARQQRLKSEREKGGHCAPDTRPRLGEEPAVLRALLRWQGRSSEAGGAGRPPGVKPVISVPREFLIKRLTFSLIILAHSFQENLICNHYDKNEYSSRRLINSYYMTGEMEGRNPDNSSSGASDSGAFNPHRAVNFYR